MDFKKTKEKREKRLEDYFIFRLINFIYYFSLSLTIFSIGVFSLILGTGYKDVIILISFSFIAYAVLKVTKEGFLYLAYGKSLSWEWIKFKFFFVMLNKFNSAFFLPNIAWSENPGAYEGYLKRIYDNPLIDINNKNISQVLVNDAINYDRNNLHELTEKIKYFYSIMPKELEINASQQLNEQNSEIDSLIESCYEVGGEAIKYIPQLTELREKIIQCWKILLSNKPEELEKLEKAELHYLEIKKKTNNPFFIQLVKNKNLISDYMVEVLLFEDIQTFDLIFSCLSHAEKVMPFLKLKVPELIKKAEKNGITIPMLSRKLKIMGLKHK